MTQGCASHSADSGRARIRGPNGREATPRCSTKPAVRIGLSATGIIIIIIIIITAAAVMIVVFGSFVLGGQRITQEFGIGLAVAVLLDAVVIRSALVPAVMQLLGRANWYLPGWLHRLPQLHLEPATPDLVPILEPSPPRQPELVPVNR